MTLNRILVIQTFQTMRKVSNDYNHRLVKTVIVSVYNFAVKFSGLLICSRLFHVTWLSTVGDISSSHRKSRGRRSVYQARTKGGKVLLLLWSNVLFNLCWSVSCSIVVNSLHLIFYPYAQLIKDGDYQSYENCNFGNADVKNEYSLDCSNCISKQGKTAVYLTLVLYCLQLS